MPRLWGQSECSHAAARHWEGLSPALHEGPMRGGALCCNSSVPSAHVPGMWELCCVLWEERA